MATSVWAGDWRVMAGIRPRPAVTGGALETSGSGQEQRTGGFPSGAGLHPGHPETSSKTGSCPAPHCPPATQ